MKYITRYDNYGVVSEANASESDSFNTAVKNYAKIDYLLSSLLILDLAEWLEKNTYFDCYLRYTGYGVISGDSVEKDRKTLVQAINTNLESKNFLGKFLNRMKHLLNNKEFKKAYRFYLKPKCVEPVSQGYFLWDMIDVSNKEYWKSELYLHQMHIREKPDIRIVYLEMKFPTSYKFFSSGLIYTPRTAATNEVETKTIQMTYHDLRDNYFTDKGSFKEEFVEKMAGIIMQEYKEHIYISLTNFNTGYMKQFGSKMTSIIAPTPGLIRDTAGWKKEMNAFYNHILSNKGFTNDIFEIFRSRKTKLPSTFTEFILEKDIQVDLDEELTNLTLLKKIEADLRLLSTCKKNFPKLYQAIKAKRSEDDRWKTDLSADMGDLGF